MNISWSIDERDIQKVKEFVVENDNPFVQKRYLRNVKKENIILDKNSIIKCLMMCLLTSQQRSGPNTPVGKFLRLNSFPITYEIISTKRNVKGFIEDTLRKHDLNRFIDKISSFFETNYQFIIHNDWQIIKLLEDELLIFTNREKERDIAEYFNDSFIGIGPKQSRNFLQTLGLTIFEIPIDSRITNWLNNFGFPVILSSIALQDKDYYNFVSDGIQMLCDESGIFPCILDAAIFSSFDNGEWTVDIIIY